MIELFLINQKKKNLEFLFFNLIFDE